MPLPNAPMGGLMAAHPPGSDGAPGGGGPDLPTAISVLEKIVSAPDLPPQIAEALGHVITLLGGPPSGGAAEPRQGGPPPQGPPR